jgi:DNA-binding Lrp family transcriptional regulator/uncharacterized ParB-like nuclease family protein
MAFTSLKSIISNLLNKGASPAKSGPGTENAKSFTEKQKAEEAVDRRDIGLGEVPLGKIVGSVGRYHDFDGQFRLTKDHQSNKFKRIKETMEKNIVLPPVDLYKIKDEYYVLDGNHRVAAARQLQQSTIAAYIVEYLPSKQTLENILYREKTNFELNTGLSDKVELTEVGQFGWLLEQIKKHQTSLEQLTATQTSLKGAAEDWYNTVYMPLVDIIKHYGLEKAFPRRTLADLYVYISYHQWHKGREERKYGGKLDELIPNSMEKFRVKVMEHSDHPFPEMKQVTTAFIMISVKPELEKEIVEKLYAYDEVKELHYVPVDFDVIAKIVLERDLLSSESEVVRQFVQEKVRRIPGVTWTQTIITLASKIKNQ